MGKDDDGDLKIYDEQTALAPELAGLPALFSQARQANQRLLALTHAADEAAMRSVAKRRHDLSAALRTLGFTVKALQTGYTFADDKAPAKIEAIAKAVQIMERECACLARILLGVSAK